MKIAAIDLFCGIGGLTSGLEDSGVPVMLGYDIDQACEYGYKANNSSIFIRRDLAVEMPYEAKSIFSAADYTILAGCAPCQPFSKAANKKMIDDTRWTLVERFAQFAKELCPSVITMENVPQIASHRGGATIAGFCESLEELGYEISKYIIDASRHGVPQRRRRLVLYASKHGKIEHIHAAKPTNSATTVKEAISHLPKLGAGETNALDVFHKCRNLSYANLERLRHTTEGGGFWEWPKSMQTKLNCRSDVAGRAFTSAYGRMKWNQPSPTLTTHCTGISNGRFGHPDQDRAISLREAGILQSFPGDYIFADVTTPYNFGTVTKHIGNAVPPGLGYAIGKSILKHLNNLDHG